MASWFEFRALTFIWQPLLWLLLIVPLLGFYYARLAARRREASVRHAGLFIGPSPADVPAAAPAGKIAHARAALDHHTPAILLLLGLAAMIAAIARPQAVIVLPSRVDAIILAMDTSGSMRATDVKPTRLAAAQAAAREFIEAQPSQIRIGVVTIAATANLVQSPTDRRDDILRAIERVQLQPGSALGSGLVIALTALLPRSGIDAERIISGKAADSWTRDWARQQEAAAFKPVAPGSNENAAIVLISDGESNIGPQLLDAAKLAAERGVRIYTVGVGTAEGAVLAVEGWSMRVRLNEESLKKIADMTRGQYFRAGSSSELKQVYKHLGAKLAMGKGRETEITALFVGAGALLAMIAVLVSMLRSNRIL